MQKNPNLKPIYLKNSNSSPKCPSQNVLWLGVKLHGLGSNTRPKHIGFYIFKKNYVLRLLHIGPKNLAYCLRLGLGFRIFGLGLRLVTLRPMLFWPKA